VFINFATCHVINVAEGVLEKIRREYRVPGQDLEWLQERFRKCQRRILDGYVGYGGSKVFRWKSIRLYGCKQFLPRK